MKSELSKFEKIFKFESDLLTFSHWQQKGNTLFACWLSGTRDLNLNLSADNVQPCTNVPYSVATWRNHNR